MYKKYFKRLFDIVFSFIAIVLLSPVLLCLVVLVKKKLGSPIIFKQPRPGKDEKIFTIYKFRTMTDEKDEKGELLPDSVRLTKFGRILRSTSLDELPEIFNVIKGDMSLVGPRPLLVEYLPLYNETQKQRHNVRPGITGQSQVKGRNKLIWKDKFTMDVWYINNLSFFVDIKILFYTIIAVFRMEGINEEGHDTMSDFMGNEDNPND